MKILKKKRGEGEGTPANTKSGPPAPWENPLIPNKKLRDLYAAMAELRLLEEHLASHRRGRKSATRPASNHGEEGCRASTALSLKSGDLVSESHPGIATPFLRGTRLAELLGSGPAKPDLPPATDCTTRLHLAIGASLALASLQKGLLTAAYVSPGELGTREWKPVLRLASAHTAPILFVVLPAAATKADGQLSLTSTACGVPGIPVDSADPVALYRVAQEAILRIRSGGGPVLMECIPFRIPGKATARAYPDPDPILTMQQFLLPRGVATEDWFQSVETRFAARLNNFTR
jgi:TPP-dependent pyruvate/acetoin dehydrogenase alpha subunit